MEALNNDLCSTTRDWPHSPGVSMVNGTVVLSDHASRAPGPDGSPGGGGEVRWRNVTITCPGPGLELSARCSSKAIGSAEQLRDELPGLIESTGRIVIVTLTANISLPPDGAWPVTGYMKSVVVSPSDHVARSPPATVVSLYDLTLVNLPYASRARSPAMLTAVAVLSFAVSRSSAYESDTNARVEAHRCTLVISDPEFAFWQGVASRGDDRLEQWGEDSNYIVSLRPKAPLPPTNVTAAVGLLAVERLEMIPEGPLGVSLAQSLPAALESQFASCGSGEGYALATFVNR
ncbi:hypothetical protein GPECTOR_15g343 [Gonium pectorale]|uniref:Uncharacterized protein n=1 Tax=Gonium pectorale TaxID=33097 RepID=A0A150GLC8_GONPE|nr:hypothetical protein GPECTOR_15g343 [Gonium pectorale]|eukprot:KXZ50659.1 hypothetical protein GPECTOR_15g343 [Gonium pectorale]